MFEPQDDWWAQDKPAATPAGQHPAVPQSGPSGLIPITPPRQPSPQTPVQAAKDAVELEAARLNLAQDRAKPADGKPKKVMPETSANNLSSAVTSYGGLKSSLGGFRDDYAGNWLTGDLENQLDAVIGSGTEGQRQWWATFRSLDNQIRNDLFGSALTPTEKSAYEGTTISPAMTPKTIRDNLATRAEIIRKALSRRAAFYKANNYEPEAVDALIGEYAPDLASDYALPASINSAPKERTPTNRDDKAAADESVVFGDDPRAPTGYRLKPEQEAQVLEAAKAGDVGQAVALMEKFTGIPSTPQHRQSVADAIAHFLKNPGAGISMGYAGTDTEAQNAADVEKFGTHLDEQVKIRKETPGSSVASGARAAANTASFGLANPLDAATDALWNGTTFKDAMQKQRSMDEADRRVNPGATLGGTVVGAMMIPSRAGAVAATTKAEALTGGAAVREAMAAGRGAGARQLAKEGGIYGATYGTAENLDSPDRLSKGAVSGALGAAGGYGFGQLFGAVANRFGAAARADRAGPVAPGVEAAEALDIAMPKFVGGTTAQHQTAAALEKSPFGVGPIRKAQTEFIDSGAAARDRIASDVGETAELPAMGDTAREGLQAWRKTSKANVDTLYTDARSKIGDAMIAPQNTIQEVGKLIREEGESLIDTPAMGILQKLTTRLENGEAVTVEGARKTRSTLRNALSETMTPSNADRITNRVMDAIQSDVARDAPQAAAAFKLADTAHGERMGNIRDVLAPFIGKKGDAWGADVARKLVENTQSNGERLDEVLKLMPKGAADDVRATLIGELGRSRDGAQNAAGDAFSFDTFLTNWNAIRGSRERIFSRETYRALNQLAEVADRAKAAGRERNVSNTGTVTARDALLAPVVSGVTAGAATGNVTAGVGTAVGVTLVRGVAQYLRASALAKPVLVRRIANTPEDAKGALRYWTSGWVDKLAAKEPTIAAEVTGLRDFMVQTLAGKAAATDDDKRPRLSLPEKGAAQH